MRPSRACGPTSLIWPGPRRPRTLQQIRLVQLGTARGTVINEEVHWQVAFLAFILTFTLACATLIFLTRVSRGWRMESLSEHMART